MHLETTVNSKRTRNLNEKEERFGPVVYWMSRDQRAEDNWALLYAQQRALTYSAELYVVFCLQKEFLGAQSRHFAFMIDGLHEVAHNLKKKNISFHLLEGTPQKTLPYFIREHEATLLVTDFSPLKIGRAWREVVSDKANCLSIEVDAHNIVPVWEASERQEYAARTIRPKIHKKLSQFLTDYPKVKKHPYGKGEIHASWPKPKPNIYKLTPGEKAAHVQLREFLQTKGYAEKRNDPNEEAVSGLSPYLHFGHISAQRVALETKKSDFSKTDKNVFLEEIIIRKELSDNFCFYNENYDSPKGFPKWAQKTLQKHRDDTREYVYTQEDFEAGKTHDAAWNAAQMEMVKTGKMHGYMRMYWGKKILEWTKSVDEAMKIAIYLNDTYEFDGRDPNGYVGITWSLGGVHDRPWKERPIFGTIRFMSYDGLKRKFDVEKYIATVKGL